MKELRQQKFKNFGGLIKWPHCVIIGEPITIDQAKEVLSRTDSFFMGYGSNAREYDKEIWKEIGVDYECCIDPSEDWNTKWTRINKFRQAHKLLELEYLSNNYISSCYIGGCYGWCHPNGTIHFWDNIGKYPSWEELHEECKLIARAFPFLKMKIYLFNQESCIFPEDNHDQDKQCIGGFRINSGRVYLLNKKDYLDPSAEETRIPYDNYREYMYNQKRDIFGEKADSTVFDQYRGEVFFSKEEFRSYFDSYYGRNSKLYKAEI